jgi:hypothetical protein
MKKLTKAVGKAAIFGRMYSDILRARRQHQLAAFAPASSVRSLARERPREASVADTSMETDAGSCCVGEDVHVDTPGGGGGGGVTTVSLLTPYSAMGASTPVTNECLQERLDASSHGYNCLERTNAMRVGRTEPSLAGLLQDAWSGGRYGGSGGRDVSKGGGGEHENKVVRRLFTTAESRSRAHSATETLQARVHRGLVHILKYSL